MLARCYAVLVPGELYGYRELPSLRYLELHSLAQEKTTMLVGEAGHLRGCGEKVEASHMSGKQGRADPSSTYLEQEVKSNSLYNSKIRHILLSISLPGCAWDGEGSCPWQAILHPECWSLR